MVINSLMSLCKFLMSTLFGFGINDSPFLSIFIWSSVRVVCLANITISEFDSEYGSDIKFIDSIHLHTWLCLFCL